MTALLLLSLLGPAWAASRSEALGAAAIAASEQGDRASALELSTKALKKDPDNLDALAARATALFELVVELDAKGDADEADAMLQLVVDTWRHVVAIAPDSSQAAVGREVLRSSVSPVLVQDPEPVCPEAAKAKFVEAESAVASRDLTGARVAYGEALQACPDNHVWWTRAGDAWLVTNGAAEALDRYERALQIAPCYAPAHRASSDALTRLDRFEEGLTAARRAIACNPEYSRGWDWLADLAGRLDHQLLYARVELDASPAGEPSAQDALAQARELVASRSTTLDRAPVVGDPELGWLLLAEADRQECTDEVLFLLALDETLAPVYLARRVADRDAIAACIERVLYRR